MNLITARILLSSAEDDWVELTVAPGGGADLLFGPKFGDADDPDTTDETWQAVVDGWSTILLSLVSAGAVDITSLVFQDAVKESYEQLCSQYD